MYKLDVNDDNLYIAKARKDYSMSFIKLDKYRAELPIQSLLELHA